MQKYFKNALRRLGYEVYKVPRPTPNPARDTLPPPIQPVWPLPNPSGKSKDEITSDFNSFRLWHYAYQFEGGINFDARHDSLSRKETPDRPLQRFVHFMPYLMESQGGSLKGKTVLDIACNSGFWAIQCALLGAAHVVGFDARQDLVDQANLIKRIVGADNAEFRVLDFWDMNPERLGQTFDIVLNLGILYHLPKPLEALEMTKLMAQNAVVLDTTVHPAGAPLIGIHWEEPTDIRMAKEAGVIAHPSRSAIELMLRHIGVSQFYQIPVRTKNMPLDYLQRRRASWMITI